MEPRVALLALVLVLAGGALADVQPDEDEFFDAHAESADVVEVVEYRDAGGRAREDFAFRAPMSGLPEHALRVYCAGVKLRLYWGVFREEVLSSQRKGIYLRRMARLARHLFEDARDVDKPFEAARLSVVDRLFAARDADLEEPDEEPEEAPAKPKGGGITSKVKRMFSAKLRGGGEQDAELALREVQAAENELQLEGGKLAKLRAFTREWAPKVLLGVYTRARVMWWMMMSCLFTKYYLWDPALDEFLKLKRSLLLWPELQSVRLQELQCKPTTFFRRLIDVCKILNPLFNLDFGTLSLDRLTRFKSDSH